MAGVQNCELTFERNKIFFYGKTQREFSYLTSEASLVSEFKLSFAIKKDFVESKKVHVEHLQHATCSFVPHFPHFENRVCLDWGISIHRCCVNTTRTGRFRFSRNTFPVSEKSEILDWIYIGKNPLHPWSDWFKISLLSLYHQNGGGFSKTGQFRVGTTPNWSSRTWRSL